jgi:hypothetical protein
MFCFLFFLLPLHLRQHSTNQMQLGHSIADPIDQELRRSSPTFVMRLAGNLPYCLGRHRTTLALMHVSDSGVEIQTVTSESPQSLRNGGSRVVLQ